MNETLQNEIKIFCKHIFEEVNTFKDDFARLVITPNEYGKDSIDVFYDISSNRAAFDDSFSYISGLLIDLCFVPFPFQEEEEPKLYTIRQDVIKDASEIATFCVKNIYNPNRRGRRNSEDFILFLFVLCSLFTKNYAAPDENTQDIIERSFIPYLDKEKQKIFSKNKKYLYRYAPSTSAAAFMQDSIANINDLKGYQKRQNEVSHGNISISYAVGTTSTKVKLETKNKYGTSQVIEFDNKVLNKINKAAAKLLVYVLCEAQMQTHKGILLNHDVSFPLSDLVSCGMYSTIPNARRGFDTAMQSLTSTKWSEMDKKTGDYNLQIYFTGATIKNGICTVQFNERLNWKEVFKQFTFIDSRIFALKENAFRLMVFVYRQARQEENRKKIVEGGYFDLSIRAIALHLGLQDTRPKEYIVDPIEKAVNEAEELFCPGNTAAGGNFMGFEFVPTDYDKLPAKQFVEEGKLRIFMEGDYAKDFIEADKRMTQVKVKAIKENEKRKAKGTTQ